MFCNNRRSSAGHGRSGKPTDTDATSGSCHDFHGWNGSLPDNGECGHLGLIRHLYLIGGGTDSVPPILSIVAVVMRLSEKSQRCSFLGCEDLLAILARFRDHLTHPVTDTLNLNLKNTFLIPTKFESHNRSL